MYIYSLHDLTSMEMQIVSKSRIKYLQSLKLKKYREKYAAFVAEGRKTVGEFLNYNPKIIRGLYALSSWYDDSDLWKKVDPARRFVLDEKSLMKISLLKTPDQVYIECEQAIRVPDRIEVGWYIYLDGISDPGNFGTIVRAAEWFGVCAIFASPNSTEPFGPKCVQASMGSHARMPIYQMAVIEVHQRSPELPWFIATQEGVPVNQLDPQREGIIVIGSESHGVSRESRNIPHRAIAIPRGQGSVVESLNAAIAASVIMSQLMKPKTA